MAKPRVFISSTFYDLRYVREDIERFVLELGYEPVRYEGGAVPYSSKAPLEESAYREVAFCDIIVCVLGGRYGTDSATRAGSITQNELMEALDKGVQVYVFVDQNVLTEFETYRLNKDNRKTKYRFVDNVKIFEFLEEIYSLPQNNPITPFQASADISTYLKVQWAGLFQRFLQEGTRLSEVRVLDEMKTVSSTLKELVKFLTEERRNKDEAIQNILLANHPAFRQLANLTGTKYRVFFSNEQELDAWLDARSYKRIAPNEWDEGSRAEWLNRKYEKYIALKNKIFDDNGRLKPYSDDEWNEDWLEKNDISSDDLSRIKPTTKIRRRKKPPADYHHSPP